jgi:Ca2+/Na+ antiporter
MNTRDELLNGLNDAVSIIRQLANIQQRLKQVRSQYKDLKPHKKMGIKLKILLVVLIVIEVMSSLQSGNISSLIWGILGIAIVYIVVKVIYKKMNEKIDADNQQITAENEQIKVQEQAVLNDLQNVQTLYQERVGYWYPDNYCSVDAVEFFYDAVNNYRADNIKEAINLYETTLHQKRVENTQKQALDTQKQALHEQRLSNLASLVMQGQALGEMERHNTVTEFEMKKTNSALSDLRSRL